MGYKLRETSAGKTKEVEKYYDFRTFRGAGESRAPKKDLTPEAKEKQNEKAAVRKLRQLMNANFTNDSWYLTMDCIKEEGLPYVDPEEMRVMLAEFQRACRAAWKKAGGELKYVSVMAIGSRSARHFHLVMSEIPGKGYKEMRQMIQGIWDRVYLKDGRTKKSYIHLENLYGDNYGQLAAYFVKQSSVTIAANGGEKIGRRWNSSKNLVKPVTKVKEILSFREFSRNIRVPKGWYVDTDYTERSDEIPEYEGYPFIRYILIRRTGGKQIRAAGSSGGRRCR